VGEEGGGSTTRYGRGDHPDAHHLAIVLFA